MNRGYDRSLGFTLLEILALVGLLAAISWVGFSVLTLHKAEILGKPILIQNLVWMRDRTFGEMAKGNLTAIGSDRSSFLVAL